MTMRERIARAIYDAPTFDGDAVGTHLYQSQTIEMSTNSVEECRALCMEVCRDAADAVLAAMREPEDWMQDAMDAQGTWIDGPPASFVWTTLIDHIRNEGKT